jgi:hypothetical protein
MFTNQRKGGTDCGTLICRDFMMIDLRTESTTKDAYRSDHVFALPRIGNFPNDTFYATALNQNQSSLQYSEVATAKFLVDRFEK